MIMAEWNWDKVTDEDQETVGFTIYKRAQELHHWAKMCGDASLPIGRDKVIEALWAHAAALEALGLSQTASRVGRLALEAEIHCRGPIGQKDQEDKKGKQDE